MRVHAGAGLPRVSLGRHPSCGWLQADTVADPLGAVGLIVAKCPARKLMAVYRVPSFEGPEGLLQLVASSRGRLLPGGVPDMEVSRSAWGQECPARKEPVDVSNPEGSAAA